MAAIYRFTTTVAVLALAGTVLAQNTGTIYGTVSDPSGLGIPGAAVTATHANRGATRSARTGSQGEYILPLLPAGTYNLHVEASGFKTFQQQGITLSPNANVRADAGLEIGSVAESIRVTGEATLVDSRSSTVGTLIDPRRVVELPIDGRNVVGLAVLLPGVSNISAPQTFTGDRSGPSVSVSGSRGNNNLFLFDGAQHNGFYRNTGLNYPPPDALQEVKVLTNTFSAEYGRNSGAIFNAVTKSGTNEIHGAAWEFLRNHALNARNFFAPSEKPQLIQNQFGFAVGGPIRKDKLFLFGSYEGLRIRPAALGSSAFPLTAAERGGDFSGSKAIRDPLTGQPFPGNLIPSARLDTVARNLVAKTELMPLPNRPDGQLVFTFPSPSDNKTYLLRADYNLGQHTIDGRYNYNLAEQRIYNGNIPSYATADLSTPTHSVTVGDTFTLTPNLLNQARLSYNRFFPDRVIVNPFHLTDLGGKFPVITRTPPSIAIAGRVNLASSSHGNESNFNQSWQVDENIQWTKGAHSVKAGLEIFRWRYFYEAAYQTQGVFTFGGEMTGNSAADFMLGKSSSMIVASPPISAGVRNLNAYSYIQDDWKIHRRLTLNVGLRYELTLGGMYPNEELTSTFRPGQRSQMIKTAPVGVVFPGDPGIPGGTVPADKNNFAPRAGLVWDPFGSGRTAVRAAFGVFYDILNADAFDSSNNQPFRYQFTINTPPSLTDPLQGFPPLPLTVNRTDPMFVGLQTLWYRDPSVRSPYVEQFNFNVQQEIVKDLVVQAGYVGKLGHKLPITVASNPAIYGFGATLGNIDQRRIFQGFGDNAKVSTQANAAYHGLQVEVTKRYSRNFSLQGAYTFSRAIDMYTSNSIGANTPNVFDLRSQRGLTDNHAKHIASFSWIWDLPRLQAVHPLLRAAAGGWQFNGLLTARSGNPFDVQIGSDVALSGTKNQRPNVIGDPRLPSDRSKNDRIMAWFSRDAFARPATGTYGNAGRNALVGPGSSGANIGLFKNFALPGREGLRLQFRSEFFNVLNHTNLGTPRSSLADGARMGRIVGAGGARVIQFALKLLF